MDQINSGIVGAGVIGLAIARALAQAGREVVVLEQADDIGTGISSRNSEVIHAGMYYATSSLKAKMCVVENRMLREFAASHSVDMKMVGKLIVATKSEEEVILNQILAQGRTNGVEGLQLISAGAAKKMEPALSRRGRFIRQTLA